jgi:hypothetical protein
MVGVIGSKNAIHFYSFLDIYLFCDTGAGLEIRLLSFDPKKCRTQGVFTLRSDAI